MTRAELIEYLQDTGSPDDEVRIEFNGLYLKINDVGYRNLEPPVIALVPEEDE